MNEDTLARVAADLTAAILKANDTPETAVKAYYEVLDKLRDEDKKRQEPPQMW